MTDTTTAPDQWAWWRGAVTARASDGGMAAYYKVAPINANEPQSGFYETRYKSKKTGEVTRSVMALWRDAAGKLFCRDGRSLMLDDLRATERWPFASKRPIPNPTYKFWIETGAFPDEHEAAHRDRIQNDGAPDDDSLDALRDRVEDLAREAEALIAKGAAKTIGESDTAADLAERLRKLEARAEALRKIAKQPHLDEAGKVDGEWCPVRDKAEGAKARLKRFVVTPFEVAERQRQQQAANAAAQVAAQTGAPPPPAEPIRRTAGTSGGRGVRLQTVKTAIVKDYPKALAYFANNQKVVDLIQQLANAAVKLGTTPDGCDVNSDQQAA